MSDSLIAIAGLSPRVIFVAALAIALVAALLLVLAPTLSEFLLRFRARRLPSALSERLLEEWLAEVRAVEDRFGKLTFAVALALAPTKSLVQDMDEASLTSLTPVPILMDFADVKVPTDFTIRLVALILDSAILFAVAAGIIRLFALKPSGLALAALVPGVWFVAIEVYFVQRFGGSPGKLLTKLRIVTMDGSPLSYKHSFLRAAPGYFLGLFRYLAITAMILSTMKWAEYAALAPSAQTALLRTVIVPHWFQVVSSAVGAAWGLGEIMAFFAGYDRRPLHDRLAGTMVVHKIPTFVELPDAPQPPVSTSAMR